MSTAGEIAAIAGYYKQYDIAAWEIYSGLVNEKLEWLQLAAQEVGNLDDVLVGLSDKILAYQIKDKSDSFTFSSLVNPRDKLLKKMYTGWKSLKQGYPEKIIDVRLITTQPISDNDKIKSYVGNTKPSFNTFIEKYWNKIKLGKTVSAGWEGVTKEITEILNCEPADLFEFIQITHVSFCYALPKAEDFNPIKWKRIIQDTAQIRHFIFDTVGKEKKSIHFTFAEFINSTGLRRRLQTYFQHDFFVDEQHYQPIQKSIAQLNALTNKYNRGYIALVGSAGSGKSTLLTKWLKQSNDYILKYFSYVNQDMTYDSGYRGESKYFLHDIITQTRVLQPEFAELLPGTERTELASQFREELNRLSRDYKQEGTKTLIIIDGLDHIEREQNVEYSLIKELPSPEFIPEGIYFILGSRTIDGLKDLNNNIKLNIHTENRIIEIASLSNNEILNIIKSYPDLSLAESQLEAIAANTQGHPLFLRYTIERLLVASGLQYDGVIADQTFSGDIIEEYRKFWLTIQQDQDLINLLAVIARFRFSFIDIELLEANFAFSSSTLNNFLTHTRHFFFAAEEYKWQYFHNSFKWFLEEWTAKTPLSGKFSVQKDEAFHTLIAIHIESAASNYRWNLIYHLFKSRQYDKILSIATQDYFRQQWHQFRNHKLIYEDIAIGAKAAYYESDVKLWLRYLLCSSELHQRLIDFDPADYSDIYLALELQDVADSYIFNGKELLVSKEQALDYAHELICRGHQGHARKLFELAEPVFILHHSKEVDINRYDSRSYSQIDEIEQIKKWARTALHFYPLSQIFFTIEALTVRDGHNHHEDKSAEMHKRLKLRLLVETYTTIAETLIKQQEWNDVLDCLNRIQEKIGQGRTLLGIISAILFEGEQVPGAIHNYCVALIHNWKDVDDPTTNLKLSLLFALFLKDYEKAKVLFDKLPHPKWEKENDIYRRTIFDYLFDYVRLYYILTKNFPFDFENFLPEDQTPQTVVIDRHVCRIARQYAYVHHGQLSALNDITIQLKSILSFYHKGFLDLDHKVRELKPELLSLIINLAQRTSPEFHRTILDVIATDWKEQLLYWKKDEIRATIEHALTLDELKDWAIDQLQYLEKVMLDGKRVGDRSEQCIKQARLWVKLGKLDRVEINLREAFRQTIGIRGEKDYQLDSLVEWLPKIAGMSPLEKKQKLSWYLKRLDYIHDTTSHAHRAPALELLHFCLGVDLASGFELFKWLYLNSLAEFSEGLERMLKFLIEKDGANAPLYASLFTRILLFFQDNGTYGNHIAKQLTEKLNDAKAINRIIQEIVTYGIEEKRNEVIQRLISACNEMNINIGYRQEDYPVRDTYSSSDSYTSLYLDNEEKFSKNEAFEFIQTVEQALDLLNREVENSHFDWTEVINKLKSQLTEDKLRSFLRSKTFDSVKLAKIGTIANEAGFVSLAREVGYTALSKSRVAGWLKHYDGGSKIKSYQLLTQVEDKKKVSELAFKDLAFNFKEIDDKRIFEDVFPVLEILLPNPDYAELYKEVEIYSEELLGNASLNDKVPTLEEKDVIDITDLASSLMLFLYEFPVSDIKEHLETIVIESYPKSQTIVERFVDQVYQKKYFEGFLTIWFGHFHQGITIPEKHLDRIEQLLGSDQFDIILLAYHLLDSLGKEPAYTLDPIDLPLIYEMKFDSKPQLIVDEETRLKEIEKRRRLPDTNDPVEFISIYKNDAQIISKETGIPVINIAHRIRQIAEQENLPAWFNSFSEHQMANLFRNTELHMPYVRPRILRLWPALMKVVSELWRSGYLSYYTSTLLSKKVDPWLHSVVAQKRLPEIVHLTEPSSNKFSSRRGTNEAWVNDMDSKCFDRFLKPSGSTTVVAEFSFIKSLDVGRATEIRQSFLSYNKDYTKSHYIFEGEGYNTHIEDYLDYEGDEIIIFNHNQTFDIRKLWLAINPRLCIKAGWILSTGGNFRWLDAAGNIMAESVYWIDGNYQNHERLLYSETGYGWYVAVAKEALQTIKSSSGKVYLHQKCIRQYRLYQEKFGTDIDAKKELFKSEEWNSH